MVARAGLPKHHLLFRQTYHHATLICVLLQVTASHGGASRTAETPLFIRSSISSRHAHLCAAAGDNNAMVARAGLPLQDLLFVQTYCHTATLCVLLQVMATPWWREQGYPCRT
jgi:hypothetical protein